MAEINREDLLSDGALNAPKELAQSLGMVEEVLDQIIAKGGAQSSIIVSAKSTKELAQQSIHLEEAQKKLQDAQKKVVDASKKQKEAMDSNAIAMNTLDQRTGGAIGRMKELGKQMLLLAKSPIILALTVIIGLLSAAASSVKTFFTATGEGEDKLARQSAVWHQFFSTLKKGWSDMGKRITDALGENGLQGILYVILRYFSEDLANAFLKTSSEAKELADVVDDIEKRMAINIVKRAKAEETYTELVLKSQDKLKYSDEERLAFLKEGLAVKMQQLSIDKQLAQDKSKALLYEIGLEHHLTKEQVDRMTFEQKDAEFTGDEMKRLAEAEAAVINTQATFNSEVKKNAAKTIALELEIHKEKVKLLEDEVAAKIVAQKEVLDNAITAIQQEVIDGTKIKKDGDEEIKRLKIAHAGDLVQIEINALNDLLSKNILNAEEQAAVAKKLAELKLAYNQAVYDKVNELDEVTIESGKSQLEVLEEAYGNFVDGVGSLFDTLTDNRMAQLDREEEAVNARYDHEIELAGDNAKAKELIEKRHQAEQEKIEKKRIDAQRRAALFDKLVSAAQAGIATALAVSKLLATPWLAVIAGVAGAAEVAAIMAKEIPQYKDGGRTMAEMIIAGEEGIERYRTPSGQIGYTPGTATLMRLPVGTEITPHEETVRSLALERLNAPDSVMLGSGNENFSRHFKSLENTIKNKKEVHMSFSRRGFEASMRDAQNITNFLDEFFK